METQVVNQESAAVVAQSQAGGLLEAISRAAADPSVDVDKMERLMAMHERMVAKNAESAFNDALASCQSELGTIAADATNPQTRSRYATYAKLDRALRPIYTKHGISISYGTEDSPKPEHVRVIAYVSREGYTRIYRADMPADGKGAKGGDVMTKTHAAGAAMSYGARYLLKGIFNISIGEEDADGNTKNAMPEGQKADFLAAIESTDKDGLADLWERITKATTACGDVEAHEELRAAMFARKKAVK